MLGLSEAIVCTAGLLAFANCLELRLIAMEKGCSGRKYIGYVLANLEETSRRRPLISQNDCVYPNSSGSAAVEDEEEKKAGAQAETRACESAEVRFDSVDEGCEVISLDNGW